ncbi:hypothetical protein DL96DRAFT_18758 [Flagelloscypha sp. PMI_526]|nr:hypothetical protein DL96DRAFT_18758 [Flagelloscypha sp. PMI_526]
MLFKLWIYTIGAFLVQQCSAQLGIGNGFTNFTVGSFTVSLVKDSQTLYSLKTSSGFDFIPADKMSLREANGRYHLGDIRFKARKVGSTAWVSTDSATTRKPVTAITPSGSTLASANLAPTLPTTSLLSVTRSWVTGNGTLQLLFTVTNNQTVAVEIGSISAPLEFNNIFTDRTAADTNTKCSFFDPAISQDGGYVQVTPLLGTLPPLVVVPVGSSPLEGWGFLTEDTSASPYYQSQTFEGLYEWLFHTAGESWGSVTPWNAATSETLQAGQSRTYGLEFRLASSIRGIESTLQTAGRPVAVGVPGYIVHQGTTAKLFLQYTSAVSSITVSPAGALTWAANSDPKTAGWVGYTITPVTFGRSRLTITYANGLIQTVHYWVAKSAVQSVTDLGNFLTTSQWFENSTDPFKRSPSVISYDREVNAIVKDDPRAWIPGLSDEAGAGSFLAATMKQYASPVAAEVTKLERFINGTLWGSIQNTNFSVKKSVYYYEPAKVPSYSYPSSINWGNWWSWNQASSYAIDRAYDYVHVVAAYWSLYRVARNYPSLVTRDYTWYLTQAASTINAMMSGSVGYNLVGLMGETVYLSVLLDLKREGLTSQATTVENNMKTRWNVWKSERYPFGSEMAWDSTGEEGVYAWSKYFADSTTSTNTINAILAYQPTIPSWAYNGNARRYWDNIYGGKLQRIERQVHHYGSGLNALPLISEFQSNPTDYYLLRVAYGGLSGSLSNIDSGGFASASFHSFANTLKWDAYSGDYGPNFSGMAQGILTVLVNHPDFGWQAFGGVATTSGNQVSVSVRDPVRRRVFIAPISALLTLDAGSFDTFVYDTSAKTITLGITAITPGISTSAAAPNGRLLIAKTTSAGATVTPQGTYNTTAGAYTIPFTSGAASVVLTVA